jgi:hypothetical protein
MRGQASAMRVTELGTVTAVPVESVTTCVFSAVLGGPLLGGPLLGGPLLGCPQPARTAITRPATRACWSDAAVPDAETTGRPASRDLQRQDVNHPQTVRQGDLGQPCHRTAFSVA